MIAKILFFTLIISFSFKTFSQHDIYKFSHKNYSESEKSKNYINFKVKKTTIGLFHSEVTGYILNFTLKTYSKQGRWTHEELKFSIRNLDVSHQGLNEKIHMYCLDYSESKTIVLVINTPLQVGQNMKVPAKILIRKEMKKIGLMVSIAKTKDGYLIEGHAKTSFTGLSMPNPSNYFEKFDNEINIDFKLNI